jgi:hypothetical protein
VAQSQNLSLSLRKLNIFPNRFEFVSIDVCPEGNCPAMSKHQLLKHWPTPLIVRNVAKFVGFVQFYSWFIPSFEVCILPLCKTMLNNYTKPISYWWSAMANAAFDKMRGAILANPCLQRYNHRKLLVLCTNFFANGFSYVACQPADNDVSLAAMYRCMRGNGFDFMTKTSAAVLHPVAFGCRRTRGSKKCLHLQLGKEFVNNYSINKCRHMCFGQRFTWVTNCYAIKFILSYDRQNPAILRLQMRFMCWDMEIKHRNDHFLTDADYWSHLVADLCFNPLLKNYIKQVNAMRTRSPSPTALPPAPENMPYFRGPRLPAMPPLPALYAPGDSHQATLACIASSSPSSGAPVVGLQHLSNYLVCFGMLPQSASHPAAPAQSLYNSNITFPTSILAKFDWAVYGFNISHFASTFKEHGLPFNVILACDPFANNERYSRKSVHVRRFCLALLCFLIIFGAPASPPPCVDILSTLTNTPAPSLPAVFGRYTQILLPSCISFVPSCCLLHSFTQITTVAPSCSILSGNFAWTAG